MSFISRLFGKADDPTRDWPPSAGPSPQMNVERGALESFGARLTLGDRVEKAKFLGRPDTFEVSGAWTFLRYERWGIVLEFEERRLFSVEFQIGGHEGAEAARVEPIEPRGPDDLRLTAQTTRAELLERLGPPGDALEHPDSRVLYYTRAPMVLSYELNADGRLVRWKILANIGDEPAD